MHRRKRNRSPVYRRTEFPAACIPALWPRRPRSLRCLHLESSHHQAQPKRAGEHAPSNCPLRGQRIPSPRRSRDRGAGHAAAKPRSPLQASKARIVWPRSHRLHRALVNLRCRRVGAMSGKRRAKNLYRTSRRPPRPKRSRSASARLPVRSWCWRSSPVCRHSERGCWRPQMRNQPPAPLQAGIPEFQVEVADVNNRRWMLKGGGEAGSPFVDTSSRRNAQPPAISARKNAVKSDRPNESDDASDAPAPEIPQPRTAKPSELALARPLKSASVASQVQNLPPSIFDGITPPIGSLVGQFARDRTECSRTCSRSGGRSRRESPGGSSLTRVAPVYPSDALKAGVRGEVSVRATIGKDGVPTNLNVVSGDPRLIRRRFRLSASDRAATLEGQPIETTTTVTIAFGLN